MDLPKKFHLIPEGEECCVWMAAGIVDYQLCPKALDCKSCALDEVFRRRFPSRPAMTEGPPASGQPQPDGFLYSRNHWWVCPVGQTRARLGLETDLAHALQGLKAVVLPSLDQRAQRGQTCAWVVMDGATMPLRAPVSGTVAAVNHDLTEHPYLLALQPFDRGWLCELETDAEGAGMDDLMPFAEAREPYAADRTRFSALLAGTRRGRRPVPGVTLADGGKRLRNNAGVLGASRYLALVRQAFGGNRR